MKFKKLNIAKCMFLLKVASESSTMEEDAVFFCILSQGEFKKSAINFAHHDRQVVAFGK